MNIEPVERLVFDGLARRFAKAFNCKQTMVTNAYEKMRLLKDRRAGGNVVYPMAFLRINSLGATSERYVSPYLARTGIQVVDASDGNSAIAVKLIPATFHIDIEYRTNEFDLSIEHSALAFSRRWLFARRNGLLKFNIAYGKVNLRIGAILDEQVIIPDKSSVTEQVSEYVLTASMQLEAWVSEPKTRIIGTVNDIQMDDDNFWKYGERK